MVPLVTVVIPAYNPGEMLAEAIESIHNQTYTDWEIVVVDDGSAEDVSYITQRFPRVHLLTQPNSGASVARNRGILQSSAPFLALMDQDDLWTTTKLEHQVLALEQHPDVGLAYCDLQVTGRRVSQGSLSGMTGDLRTEVVIPDDDLGDPAASLRVSLAHFGNRFVVPSTILYRRECLAAAGLMDPWRPFTGDFDMLVRVAARHNAVHVASTDVLYRKHDDNFTGSYDVGRRELAKMRRTYTELATAMSDKELASEARLTLRRPRSLYASQAFDRSRLAWQSRSYTQVTYHMCRSIAFNPSVVIKEAGRTIGRWTKRSIQ